MVSDLEDMPAVDCNGVVADGNSFLDSDDQMLEPGKAAYSAIPQSRIGLAATAAPSSGNPHSGSSSAEQMVVSRPPSLSASVPADELAGTALEMHGDEVQGRPAPAAFLDSEQGDSSCGMDSPGSIPPEEVDAGYESSDDMDFMNARHCINCTGDLWGDTCTACGYEDGQEMSIFRPQLDTPSQPRSFQANGSTVISFDDRMLLHDEDMLPLHPERADRIRAVMARLHAAQLEGRCRRLPSREATPQEVERCHVPELMTAVNMISERSRLQGNETLHWPTSDTYVNQHTAMCARLSAGACVDVAVAVTRGEAANGVAVVRPPGHHAESNTAMGFCFFNNAGIAARAAQAAGAGRVLILDWDVHHGNGTQHIFEDDPSVMYMSLHRYDGGHFYPGTGAVTEVGHPGAEGTTVNVPWPCGGMRNGDYMAAFQHLVLPIAYEFAPDLVIISAGFDAAEGDPIGGCNLTPEVFAHMTAMLQMVAPTALLLEGGYNLLAVAKSTEACVRVLLGERPPPLPAHQPASEAGMGAIAVALRVQARYWRSVRGLLSRLLPPPSTMLPLKRGSEDASRLLPQGEGEEDTDTPHMPRARGAQQFGQGSGWESEGDPFEPGLGEGAALHHAASDTSLSGDGADGGSQDDGSRGVQQCGEPQEVDSGRPECGSQQLISLAALDAASPDLMPLQDGPDDVRTPHIAHYLASSTPGTALGSVRRGGESEEEEEGGGDGGEGLPAAAGRGQHEKAQAVLKWRRLALKAVAMKRAGRGGGPRLSPQLTREAPPRDVGDGLDLGVDARGTAGMQARVGAGQDVAA